MGDPDLVAPGAIRDERDGPAVGRPLRCLAAGRHVIGSEARDVPAAGGDRSEFSPRRAVGPGPGRVMSPRRVTIVRTLPGAEITAGWPDGERSNPSTTLATVST